MGETMGELRRDNVCGGIMQNRARGPSQSHPYRLAAKLAATKVRGGLKSWLVGRMDS